jgi:G patch domain-containing protein 1
MDVDGEKHMRKDHWEVPKMEKSAAEAALQGFMPFSDNIAKQQRYKQYLNVQAGLSEEKIEKVEGFSGEDMTKELNEFVQAARIFKPLSTSMSSRFTSASRVIEIQQPATGLRSAADIQSTPIERLAPAQRTMQLLETPVSNC